VLSAKDGRLLFEASANSYTAFHNGAIQLGDGRYNPRTGKRLGEASFSLASTICTPRYFVNDIFVDNRGGKFQVGGESVTYRGVRGGCLFASVPAFGQFFTPQNWCRCAPGQIQGFVAFGPITREPTPAEMERAPAVTVGPAFGNLAGKLGAEEWPTYRHDAQRSSRASCAAPARLDTLWKTSVCKGVPSGPIGADWRERLTSPLTAPTVAAGLVVVAATERHEVVALDALSGNERWRFTAGARVDTPPTLHDGGCFFGANDGYVYALSSHDGRLAWRTRAAPLEERMVSYGKVESPWPVTGAVLVSQGLLFASAGRSGVSDGGIVIHALEPATGRAVWSKSVVKPRLNDILLEVGDSIQWMSTRLDPRTGAFRSDEAAPEATPRIGLEGLACGNWLRLGSRKHAPMAFGNVSADLLSWSEQAVCAAAAEGTLKAIRRDRVSPGSEKPDPADELWNTNLPTAYQATSMVLCPDALVVGGGLHAEGQAGSGGFVRVLSLEDGEPLAERKLPAPVSYNGLALAGGRLYATLTDGTTLGLGTQAEK
jgi:outer membrane protein assembly factor BamB